MSVYKGTFDNENWYQVTKDNALFDHHPSLKVRNHSPDGFAWSYGGSGPAQLSLAILLEELRDQELAQDLYQRFKFEVIAGLPNGSWEMTSEEIMAWVKKNI